MDLVITEISDESKIIDLNIVHSELVESSYDEVVGKSGNEYISAWRIYKKSLKYLIRMEKLLIMS